MILFCINLATSLVITIGWRIFVPALQDLLNSSIKGIGTDWTTEFQLLLTAAISKIVKSMIQILLSAYETG